MFFEVNRDVGAFEARHVRDLPKACASLQAACSGQRRSWLQELSPASRRFSDPALTTFSPLRRTKGITMRALIPGCILLCACAGSVDAPSRGDPANALPGGPTLGVGPATMSGVIHPGRVVAHRLNRVEYDNTIRDLFGVELHPSSQFGFPEDNYIEGFDNNADSLSASPLLLEKYRAAAAAIVTQALDPAPANAAQRARIMTCDPATAGQAACADQILTGFATRAFRRPVTAAEIAPYAALLGVAGSFEQAISLALQAMLLSPKFVFRVEANPAAGTVAPLDGYELASRLSYFLWSSMPDAELMQRAADRSLLGMDEIARQVARMLQDPKAASLLDNLAGEWFASRELAVKEITLSGFTFDDGLRDAMGQEAKLFLGELIRGDHPLGDLLDADFMFVNDRLAQHYGLPNAGALGAAFQELPVSDARRGGGVLTQANFLTVTSQRDRTSPTRRGKWVSENLLCVVIPPPPPKIPELAANDMTMPTSTRARLELHRQKGTTCNGCHQYMDPLGLAFEHYDAVGRYRDTDLGAAIDASGEIPITSVPFDGVGSLTRALAEDPRVDDCVTRKLFTYALGRVLVTNAQPGADIDDAAALADVNRQLFAMGNRMASLFTLIAQSPLMTMRTGEL
jgi:hypothetical protein